MKYKTLPSGLKYRINDQHGVDMEGAKTLARYHAICKERDNIDCYKHDCFFAFSNKQFEEGKARIRPLREGEKLCSAGAGLYGTSDGLDSFFGQYKLCRERIKEECDPQEVYFYEYNNHEAMYSGDSEPFKIVQRIWGKEVAAQIVRIRY